MKKKHIKLDFKRKSLGTTWTLSKYIAIEFLFNFIVCFLFFFVMFLVNQLLVMASTLLEKQIPLNSVIQMLFYYTPYIIGMTFPFATLVAGLMSVGRLSADNEIQAFRASGLRYMHLFKPLLIVSIFLFLLSLTMNSYFMYVSAKRRNQLMFDIAYTKPELIINPNSNTSHGEMVIYAGDIKDSKIENLVIIDKDDNNNKRIILAEDASLAASEIQKGVTEVKMDKIFAHSVPARVKNEFEFAIAERMIYNILIDEGSGANISSISDSDKTLQMLYKEISEINTRLATRQEANDLEERNFRYEARMLYEEIIDKAANQSKIDTSQLTILDSKYENLISVKEKVFTSDIGERKETEFHKKLFMPVGCIVMIVLAFPLGMYAKRSGKSVGFIIGVLISVVYWFLFMISFILARRAAWAEPEILWVPNILIFIVGNILYVVRLRH